MERPVNTAENDIATERYKGPGALVTGAGEGAIAHYGTGLAGLLGGGTVSYLGYKQVNAIEKSFQNFHATTRDSNFFMRGLGNIAGFTRWAAHSSIEHLPGRQRIFSRIPKERLEAVIFGGGLMGFIGFFVAPVLFMFSGAKHSNDGRRQFEDAQDEILTARGERDALRDKYVAAQTELETLKAPKQTEPAIKIAADAPPLIEPAQDGATAALAKAELKDSPVSISPPKIEGPPIQSPPIKTPTIEGHGPESSIPKNQWWDGKEHGASHAERLASRDAEAALHEAAR